jgi:hypothetical protein
MPMNFYTGVIVGVAGVWLFHKFVSPIPGGKSGARSGG